MSAYGIQIYALRSQVMKLPFSRMQVGILRVAILSSLAHVGFSQEPTWVAAMGSNETAEYYQYSSSAFLEQNSIYTPRPQWNYAYQSTPSAMSRGVCAIVDQPGVYWFNSAGQSLVGQYPSPAGGDEFNVSRLISGVKGIQGLLDFYGVPGSPQPSGSPDLAEVMYFTTRDCSDAGTEYGFSKDIVTGALSFYYSTYNNCYGRCHTQDLFSSPLVPANGAVVSITNLQKNKQGGLQYYWEAYLVPNKSAPYGYSFVIDAKDPETLGFGQCSLNGGPIGNCTWPITPASWFPANQLTSGYIVAGAETTFNSSGQGPNLLSTPAPLLSAVYINVGQ